MIVEGRVGVNGRTVRTPASWVDPRSVRITLDGKPIRKQTFLYLAMNKPRGVLTTRSDERNRKTVYDLLPRKHRWVFPIGRLDKETSGLLLLTNDTRFGERVTNPLSEVWKTYIVTMNGPLMDHHIAAMEAGMRLENETLCHPAAVNLLAGDRRRFEIAIREGMNRQVRRMCETLGYEVVDLIRVRIGPIGLGDLPEGSMRHLTPEEISFVETQQKGES